MKKLLFIMLLLAVPAGAASVTIKFIDSVNVEEAYLQSNGAIANYGRVPEAGATRVIHYMGRNFSNNWNSVMRFPFFKDSTDNYTDLTIDSFKIVQKIHTATYDANDDSYIFAVGVDTNMNWNEGNRAGAEAQDCEVSWDSAQQVGTGGTCATNQTWLTSGVRGTTDTMGIWGGTPADSFLAFTDEVANDSIVLYVDTQVVNQWKDYAYANEGVVLFTRGGPNDQYFHKYYSSESNMAGFADSIPYAILYGSTPEVGVTLNRRRKILGGQ